MTVETRHISPYSLKEKIARLFWAVVQVTLGHRTSISISLLFSHMASLADLFVKHFWRIC